MIIGISIISVISLPASDNISSTYDFPLEIDPFEISPWFSQIIISTIILLTVGFLYLHKKLPSVIYRPIEFMLNLKSQKKLQ